MRLLKLTLKNFRCYRDLQMDFDDITAIVGKNDAGKSSIMDALDIFLNDGKPDKDDACKSGNPSDLEIICEFDDLPAHLVIDETAPTTFAAEYLLNGQGQLVIGKKYSGQLAAPACTGVFARALHPRKMGFEDLLLLKNSELKNRAKEHCVDLAKVDARVNAAIRQAIWSSAPDLDFAEVDIPLAGKIDSQEAKEDAKRAWENIKTYLPAFALFKSDRESTDQDDEAQDPMKAAVKEAIKSQQQRLGEIFASVKQEVLAIAQKTCEKLQEMDKSLAEQLKPEFPEPKWDTLFKATIIGDGGIPLNKRGSGVRRLILLNFFRAKAEIEARQNNRSQVIYGIEEPETSQHPSNQRLLLSAFRTLSETSQIVLTTHTPMLARALPDTNLRFIDMNSGGSRSVLIGGSTTNEKMAKSLGVLPDNNVKLFVGVEGWTDIEHLKNFSRLLRNAGEDVPDLDGLERDGELIFMPVAGSNLAVWVCRLQNLQRPEFYLLDRDSSPPEEPKNAEHAAKINARSGCKAVVTEKLEIENYLHKKAIETAFSEDMPGFTLDFVPADFVDVPNLVAKRVHTLIPVAKPWDEVLKDERELKSKESSAKKRLTRASAKMDKGMLDEIDPKGEVLGWFRTMKLLCSAQR